MCISASLCYKRLSNASHNFNALMCFEATKKRNKIFSNKFSNHFCNISTFSMQTIFRSPLNIEKADLELEKGYLSPEDRLLPVISYHTHYGPILSISCPLADCIPATK